MPLIQTLQPWDSQPQESVGIAQPQTAVVMDASNFADGFTTKVLGLSPTVSSNVSQTVGRGGRQARFDGSTTSFLEYDNVGDHNVTGPLTLLCVYETFGPRSGNEHMLLSNGGADWRASAFLLYAENSGVVKLGRSGPNFENRSWIKSVESFVDGTLVSLVATSNTFTAGSGLLGVTNFYVNGRKLTSVIDFEAGTSDNITSASLGLRVGSADGATGLGLNGAVYAYAIMSGAMIEAEAIEYSANPWQLFAPLSLPMWIGAAAAAAPSYYPRRRAQSNLLML